MTPDDRLRVNRIESYKEIQEELPPPPPDEEKKKETLIAAAFSAIVSKFFPSIRGRKKGVVSFENKLYSHLAIVRAQLEKLKTDDQTKDASFTHLLSQEWCFFLAQFEQLSPKEPTYPKMEKLIKEFDAFPTKDEHAFGYYLRHYAGEKWLPFPYLEILRTFTRDYLVYKEKSDLGHFLRLIGQILGDEN